MADPIGLCDAVFPFPVHSDLDLWSFGLLTGYSGHH